MTTSTVKLPFPVSVNNLFLNIKGRGRIRSPRYRAWAKEAGWMMAAQRPAKFDGTVTVTIDLCAPDKRRRDADNLGKAILDLLTDQGVIVADDSRYVREVRTRWNDAGDPCLVTIQSI